MEALRASRAATAASALHALDLRCRRATSESIARLRRLAKGGARDREALQQMALELAATRRSALDDCRAELASASGAKAAAAEGTADIVESYAQGFFRTCSRVLEELSNSTV
jgi:hypothetical protein